MPFTSLTTVKKHLLSAGFGTLQVEDVEVQLNGTNKVQLPHLNLVDISEAVKIVAETKPTREGPFGLYGTDWADLSYPRLVRGSTVVTLSDALATVYIEEVDYQTDHLGGRIRRIPGGAIPDAQPVIVFYLHYTLFDRNNDYELDPVAGTLRRCAGSAIPDGARVHVDYEVTAGDVTDELILQVIDDVQDRIVRVLAPGYTGSSSDYALQTGATQLVLAGLARAMAREQLAQRLLSDSAERAREWQRLADSCEAQGWRILRPFLDPYQLHAPEKAANA